MIGLAKCDECPIQQRATKDLLSTISVRRGMSLREIRTFLFGRHGFRFERADELVKELKEAGFIVGTALKFRVPGQRGARRVQ